MKKLLFILLVLCSCSLRNCEGCSPYMQHEFSNQPLRWASLPVGIRSELGFRFDKKVKEAYMKWNKRIQCFWLTEDIGQALITIVFHYDACKDEEGKPGIAAMQYKAYTAKDLPYFQSQEIRVCPEKRALDALIGGLTHEFGHSLGLVHSQSVSSVMYPAYSRARDPSDRDLSNVTELYKR